MVSSSYPILHTLLRGREGPLPQWTGEARGKFAFFEAERILDQLCATAIVGVEKLVNDGMASPLKFEAILSEMRMALVFARLGAQVRILADDAFKPARYTPDLLVEFPSKLVVLVDVVLGSSGEPELVEHLHGLSEKAGLRYDVELILGEDLSRPSANREARINAKALVADVAQLVVASLIEEQRRGVEAGLVRIHNSGDGISCSVKRGVDAYEARYDELEFHQESWMATLGFQSTTSGLPAIGGGVTDVRFVDDDEHRAGFRHKLERKAIRRRDLPPSHQATPFLVAIDNKETDLLATAILTDLTGGRCWVGDGNTKPTVLPKDIATLSDGAWRPLLEEWNYFDERFRFREFGAFFEERATWAGELSGVLVAHGGPDGALQWLPNPFAGEPHRSEELLDIGLPLDRLGRAIS